MTARKLEIWHIGAPSPASSKRPSSFNASAAGSSGSSAAGSRSISKLAWFSQYRMGISPTFLRPLSSSYHSSNPVNARKAGTRKILPRHEDVYGKIISMYLFVYDFFSVGFLVFGFLDQLFGDLTVGLDDVFRHALADDLKNI